MLDRLRALTALAALAVLLAGALLAPPAGAQAYRADDAFYLKGRVGLNTYGGDRDANPDNELSEYVDAIGFSLGIEGGYHLSERFSIGLMHLSGSYPKVDQPRDFPGSEALDAATTSQWRHHLNLLGRAYLLPGRRMNPYAHLGLSLGLGQINDEINVSIGPMGGLGVDVAVSDQVGLFIEVSSMLAFPDDALDADDPSSVPAGEAADDSGFDAFNYYGLGLRYTLKAAFTPVGVLTLDCPETLVTGEAGTFTATVAEGATPPVTYGWRFGDGAEEEGLLATHAYDQAGTYTATFTARNDGSSDEATCSVRAIAPAAITTVTAEPSQADTCAPLEPVAFTANVRGTAPIDYSWDFGDGASAEGATPSHTYAQPGTYTVRLTARNAAGADQRTVTVTVAPCPSDCDVEEMNAALFDRNSSVLTAEAQAALAENLAIFQDCPSLCGQLQGVAGESERAAAQLAEDRARAVQQFYAEGGAGADRFTLSSEVRAAGKEDASLVRRADTVPVACE